MAKIKTLKDSKNETIYPKTTSEAVLGSDGQPIIPQLEEKIKDVHVDIDATLTKENVAADAKATGDKIQLLRDLIRNRPSTNTLTDYFDYHRDGKVYQTKLWKVGTNPTPTGIKMLDNEGLNFAPSTDTVEEVDDYANIPLFDWWHCNYVREENGDVKIVAIEGDDDYAETGSVDVGAFGMSFYWNWDDSNDEYTLVTISDSPNEQYSLVPWPECVNADGTINAYWCHSAYPSVLASDGKLRSQPNGKVSRNQSYQNMIANYAKKGAGYKGAGVSRNTFQIVFNTIKGNVKNSQKISVGLTNYNLQYNAAVERPENDTYFPVTSAQAANLEVGTCVSVGYAGNNNGALNKDRGVSSIHAYADDVQILRIEDMDDGNKAVYLDVDKGFNTTKVALTDSLSSPIILTTMHAHTGETNRVIGKHDGSAVSNTSGKHPYRVQGTEYAIGGYIIASDTVMEFQSDSSKKVYVAKNGVAHVTDTAKIRSTYKEIGTIPNYSGSDWWIGDISVDAETGAWYPSVSATSGAQGYGDRCYSGSTSTSGTREYLQGGYLGSGSSAGSSCLDCGCWLDWASWSFLSAD
ncbi:MAG TPA: hypothetical protein DCL74_06270 [Succinivibrionaceae bacterium]|nr:hypothetical protein [Succinivibrionaceae bacterium]